MSNSLRALDEIRSTTFELHYNKYAEGSVLISQGNTKVLCNASVEENVPRYLVGTGQGWVTAEYAMLPRSTHSRSGREAVKGRLKGRTQEISRLIGRSLRACIQPKDLGERQIVIDCDVLQADGGTRCASITGGYVALYLAIEKLRQKEKLTKTAIQFPVAAVSVGIVDNKPTLDLDYELDFKASVDANFVMNTKQEIIEIQATAEEKTFTMEEFLQMQKLAQKGIAELIAIQNKALKKQ